MSITIRGPEYNFIQVNNDFIDGEMLSANGEYVKVYLLLLRYAGDDALTITEELVSRLADKLDCPERDVLRAIEYWEKVGIIEGNDLKQDDAKSKEKVEMKRLLVMVTKHLKKQLSMSEVNSVYYIYHDLKFSYELTEFLFEYCASKGKTNLNYIKTVAMNWHDHKIVTVQQAKEYTDQNYVFCYKVLSAFGISGRNVVQSEINYCNKWLREYKFSQEMVLKACERIMEKTHKPSFAGADKLLTEWQELGISSPDQVLQYDKTKKEKSEKQHSSATGKEKTYRRDYDMSALEKQLLGIN